MNSFCQLGLAVIETEAKAVLDLSNRITERFATACEILLACSGRIVVIGMGKSGHIASKIAATLASTGSPAFFVHPGEANHGDMGMVTSKDVVLALSNSGQTSEILTLLPLIKRLSVPLIALTGNPDSPLAQAATVNVDVSVTQEACPLGLAPTASTTASLVMGDALAIALLDARGFTADDFARSHPGGQLGRRLLLKVADLMHTGTAIPQVPETATIADALLEMTQKKFGMTLVTTPRGQISGIFTDGDLRRTLETSQEIHTTPIRNVMSQPVKSIQSHQLAAEALLELQTHKITVLVVSDDQKNPTGILHLHDLLQAGVI